MGTYSIKDLEKLSGIKAHTIRIWEQRYGILEPKRTGTNIRYYDDVQLKHLLNVALLSKHGYKISKISQLTMDELAEKLQEVYSVSETNEAKNDLEPESNDLLVAMIDMDEAKFSKIYSFSVNKHGFEHTIINLIYPFLEKVGILWTLDQINPAQEHFISCLIRQKVLVAIDDLPISEGGKRFVLFLPEGEFHELGLLVAHYLLKKQGAQVFYLGQNLPLKDIQNAQQLITPDYFLCFMVGPTMINQASTLIPAIKEACGSSELLLTARGFEGMENLEKSGIHFLTAISDLERFSA